MNLLKKQNNKYVECRDLPGDSVVKIPSFHWKDLGLIPDWENKIPHATEWPKKKKKSIECKENAYAGPVFPTYFRLPMYSTYAVLCGKVLENQIRTWEADDPQVWTALGKKIKGRNQPKFSLGLPPRPRRSSKGTGSFD